MIGVVSVVLALIDNPFLFWIVALIAVAFWSTHYFLGGRCESDIDRIERWLNK